MALSRGANGFRGRVGGVDEPARSTDVFYGLELERATKCPPRSHSVSEPPPQAPEPSLRISLDAAEHQAAPHCVPTNSTLNETLFGISYRVLSLFENN
ncbi:hypothetical protein HZH66_012102 [Vespula vulgaris]|uniref:Uncharacterized protein n=1 Tax=Vespula vulgaris TaxID=7454 RepID=A0A834JCB4_VESVU|nr:hypothetical protein HZH66_012102 [Vespula vulgaris]